MYVMIGLTIGLLLGLTGAGGSVFAVPLLICFAKLPVADATGMSLGAVSFAALYGSIIRKQNSLLMMKPTVVLAVTGMVSAPFGRWAAFYIPEVLLLLMFCCLSVIISIWMWKNTSRQPEMTYHFRGTDSELSSISVPCEANQDGRFDLNANCISCLVISGVVIGFVSGLFGVGGGFLIVPTLMYISQASVKQAICSSLMIISAVSSTGFISHLALTNTSYLFEIGLLVTGSALGMQASRFIATYVAGVYLQKIFSVSLVLIAILTVIVRGFDGK